MSHIECPECRKFTSGLCPEHSPVLQYHYVNMQIPHRCPVCEGKGRAPNGFYAAIGVESWSTSDITPEQCRACAGTGVLWR